MYNLAPLLLPQLNTRFPGTDGDPFAGFILLNAPPAPGGTVEVEVAPPEAAVAVGEGVGVGTGVPVIVRVGV